MKYIKLYEEFLNENDDRIKATRLIGIVNDAVKRNETVTVVAKGKTHVLSGFLYQRLKTVEFKSAVTHHSVVFKNDELITIK